jgi:hypothetical protein
LLLLAFLLPPLALYLIVLGWINRRPRPILTAGTWDFAGVLFAVSGFLLIGGPAFLSSLDEKSRLFWLLGDAESSRPSPGANWTFWIVARLIYFGIIAGGAASVLWRCRRLTSVYNVDSQGIITALEQTFQRLGLNALRTGDSFLLGGRAADVARQSVKGEGIQTTAIAEPTREISASGSVALALIGRRTALHVDVFPLMRHATLRWDPADSPLRREVEKELASKLAEVPAPEQEPLLGGCLSLLGVGLFALTLVAGGFLVLSRLYLIR